MTIETWLQAAVTTLQNAGISTARLDTLVLLADEIGQDKSWILAHPEYILQIEKRKKLSTKITQRAKHIPLAYIRGRAEFYGRDFAVNEHVLVPRPESESLIELLKQAVGRGAWNTLFDVGTGTGCLAIIAKLELPDMEVYAVDIDENCLAVARNNAKALGANIRLLRGDLLQPLQRSGGKTQDSIILANLPYVPTDYPINTAAGHEPPLALFGGRDGLDYYRTMFMQAASLPTPPTAIITESLLEQHHELDRIAGCAGYAIQTVDGLGQLFMTRQQKE